LTYWLVVQGKDHSWTCFASYSVRENSIVDALHSYSFEAGCLWPLHNSLNIIPVLCLKRKLKHLHVHMGWVKVS